MKKMQRSATDNTALPPGGRSRSVKILRHKTFTALLQSGHRDIIVAPR